MSKRSPACTVEVVRGREVFSEPRAFRVNFTSFGSIKPREGYRVSVSNSRRQPLLRSSVWRFELDFLSQAPRDDFLVFQRFSSC